MANAIFILSVLLLCSVVVNVDLYRQLRESRGQLANMKPKAFVAEVKDLDVSADGGSPVRGKRQKPTNARTPNSWGAIREGLQTGAIEVKE